MTNLPPGVSVNDIPGNSAEDAAFEALYDKLAMSGLDSAEIERRVFSPFWSRRPKKSAKTSVRRLLP
jgi:hypothetical protein